MAQSIHHGPDGTVAMNCRCQINVTILWHHYDTIVIPLWYHYDITMTPLRHRSDTIVTPLWHLYGSTKTQQWHQRNTWYHCDKTIKSKHANFSYSWQFWSRFKTMVTTLMSTRASHLCARISSSRYVLFDFLGIKINFFGDQVDCNSVILSLFLPYVPPCNISCIHFPPLSPLSPLSPPPSPVLPQVDGSRELDLLADNVKLRCNVLMVTNSRHWCPCHSLATSLDDLETLKALYIGQHSLIYPHTLTHTNTHVHTRTHTHTHTHAHTHTHTHKHTHTHTLTHTHT
jgi:hypothetical protein